jgi:Peptidase family M23
MRWPRGSWSRIVMRSMVGGVIVLALGGSSAAGTAVQQQATNSDGDAFTPLVATALAVPHAVPGTDGRVHLPYELLLTNVSAARMRLDRVETLDRESQDRVVATLTGAELEAAVEPYLPTASHELDPLQMTRVFLDLTAAPGSPLPTALAHRFSYTATPASSDRGGGTSLTGFTTVSSQPAVVLDPPLAGNRWVAGNGCCFPPSAHRLGTLPVNGALYAAQRFAIDFVQLDAAGHMYEGPVDVLTSYPYFGDPLYAVADGVVVRSRDDLPERTAGSLPTDTSMENVDGNYVVLDIGDGRFAFYAHLQTGSVQVRVGDTVRQGQLLGRLGNTGNTTGPHLHFHVMDGPSPLASNGLPYTFRAFSSEGTLTTSLDDLGAGQPATISPALAGQFEARLPLDNQVISFPPMSAGN